VTVEIWKRIDVVEESGWKNEEVDQISSILLLLWTFTLRNKEGAARVLYVLRLVALELAVRVMVASSSGVASEWINGDAASQACGTSSLASLWCRRRIGPVFLFKFGSPFPLKLELPLDSCVECPGQTISVGEASDHRDTRGGKERKERRTTRVKVATRGRVSIARRKKGQEEEGQTSATPDRQIDDDDFCWRRDR